MYDATKKSSLIIDLYCSDDNDKTKPVPQFVGFEKEGCAFRVKVKSPQACYQFTMNPLFKWLHRNSYIFGALIIVVGIVVGYFGKKLFKPAICIVGTIGTSLIMCLFIFTLFFNRDTK